MDVTESVEPLTEMGMIVGEADLGVRSGSVVDILSLRCLLDIQGKVLKEPEV